jgi:hypothetical protein
VKAGDRYRSTVCTTEIIIVRAPSIEVDVECGGAPMIGLGDTADAHQVLDSALSGGTKLGKRYVEKGGQVEVLCSKAGAGTLTSAGERLSLKTAKPLPASD